MGLAREEEVELVKADDVLACFVRGDLFPEFFAPDLLEAADVLVRDAHGKDGTPRPLMTLGGMPCRLRDARSEGLGG